jgi:hypothetical protein
MGLQKMAVIARVIAVWYAALMQAICTHAVSLRPGEDPLAQLLKHLQNTQQQGDLSDQSR